MVAFAGLALGFAPAGLAAQETRVYTRAEVDSSATPTRGPKPVHPRLLLCGAAIEGRVDVEFIVTAAGRADSGSLKILATNHQLFGRAVAADVGNWRFTAAILNGTSVAQRVQQRIIFALPEVAEIRRMCTAPRP